MVRAVVYRGVRVVSAGAVFIALLALPALSVVDTPNPPEEFQAIYLNYWSAATPSRLEQTIEFARAGTVNAVVIDIKDASGYVAFDAHVPAVAEYHTKRVVIRDIDSLVERLHREGLYVIARIVVFTDPKLAVARPDLAVHSKSKLAAGLSAETLWRDRRRLAWIDPAAFDSWDYNIAIARDALARGFDEINFDYIRFPSDGDLRDMYFPVWNPTVPRRKVIRDFFAYLRQQMGPAVISADLFGLSTVNHDDLGVGQIIEDACPYFDYVCPMVYPSHYAPGFIGKQNPAEHPYKVVHYSLKAARERLATLNGDRRARLRPWLQDFHLGARYTPEMVTAQIDAARDALATDYAGYILWNPASRYTREAIRDRAQ